MLPIFDRPIKDWKDLQDKVAKIFSDQEFEVEIEKDLKTVREVVNVDVFAKNPGVFPNEYYICECKFWNKPVSKNTIHAFRTVVSDFGANSGFIISKEGFQKGAYTAAENTNIHLMTWDEFQDAFKERWLLEMINKIEKYSYPLRKIVDGYESFVDPFFEKLEPAEKNEFIRMSRYYEPIAFQGMALQYKDMRNGQLDIEYMDQTVAAGCKRLNLSVTCLHDFFDYLYNNCKQGLSKLDNLFGKEIRKP